MKIRSALATVLVTSLVLGATYSAAAWWLGQRAESVYMAERDRVIAALGIEPITESRYERGLFSAQSRYVLQFSPFSPAAGSEPIRLHLVDDIQHGPFIGSRLAATRVQTRLKNVQGWVQPGSLNLAEKQEFMVTTTYGFGGALQGRAILPAGKLKLAEADDAMQMSWQQLNYDFRQPSGKEALQGELNWPHWRLFLNLQQTGESGEPAQLELKIDDLRSVFDIRLDAGRSLLLPGTIGGQMKRMEVTALDVEGDQPWLSLQDVHFDGRTTNVGGLLNSQVNLSGMGTIGKATLQALRYEMQLERLDAQALADADRLLRRVARAAQPRGVVPSEDQVASMMRRFIAAGPVLRGRLSATMAGDGGHLECKLSVPEATAEQSLMPSSLRLLQSGVLSASLQLPKSWLAVLTPIFDPLEQNPQLLLKLFDEGVALGFLRDDGQAYGSTVDYAQGELLINGQALLGLAAGR